jgi:RNA polymerase-binding protein DksA
MGKEIMAYLNQEQLGHFKALLDRREQELRADLQREADDKDEYIDVATEVPDAGDSSFANLAVDLDNAAMTRDVTELRAIEAARSRMDNDTYGICVECETEIPVGRLDVQPTAERCAPCQEMHEKTHADAGKGGTL